MEMETVGIFIFNNNCDNIIGCEIIINYSRGRTAILVNQYRHNFARFTDEKFHCAYFTIKQSQPFEKTLGKKKKNLVF